MFEVLTEVLLIQSSGMW